MSPEYSETDTSEVKKSKYNAAIAQLYRLDNLRKDAHNHARSIMYIKWNEDLDRYWLELVSDTAQVERKKIKQINEKLAKVFLYVNGEKLRKELPKLYAKLILAQKELLMEKEEILATLQNTQGKGTAYEDPDEDDFE